MMPDSTLCSWHGSARAALLAAAMVVAVPACGSETGLLLEVTHGELGRRPDALRVLIGVSDGMTLYIPGCGTAQRFLESPSEVRDIPLGPDHDLTTTPYRVKLTPDDRLPADAPVLLAVAALAEGQVIGMGGISQATRFIDGKVLSWPVVITGTADNPVKLTGAGCVCAHLDGGDVVIARPDDQDCDGDPRALDCDDDDASIGPTKPERCNNNIDDNCDDEIDEVTDADGDGFFNCDECDDTNAAVHPGAEEICDGYNTDCDDNDLRYEGEAPCYVRASGGCYAGKSVCNDRDPLASWGPCEPFSLDPQHREPELVCDAYDRCIDLVTDDKLRECVYAGIFTEVSCEVTLYDAGEGRYTPCPGGAALPEPPVGQQCTWTLIGGDHQYRYKAKLVSRENNGGEGAVIDACQAEIVVYESLAQPPELPAEDTFRLWLAVDGVTSTRLQLRVAPRLVERPDACPATEGLSCPGLLSSLPGAGL